MLKNFVKFFATNRTLVSLPRDLCVCVRSSSSGFLSAVADDHAQRGKKEKGNKAKKKEKVFLGKRKRKGVDGSRPLPLSVFTQLCGWALPIPSGPTPCRKGENE
jgi:hypothetical protein